ncbi:hypothetical protein SBRV1_gp39 [Sulfolobales Beppu rod-shaped virus 1]|uniref:Uncharacterized protein n=1 Tax=Sulfolobales Beppu rod-shaped virus 1 TaxID=2493121 RepID=A0A3Q8Q401_9VIRU|nr:hypothetical protein QIT32_gp39 [Sulfolobales Beppu rod-shaped virus 1]AZI75928.1 hypothetical protein SBRV1_gp39 [Sulfolobales Beppu rod-shaped virus 1]
MKQIYIREIEELIKDMNKIEDIKIKIIVSTKSEI